ncbi:hypothetical protein M2G43_20830 [Vibrio vulnificus]|nr:hypothetical protein [Vibrio cholerae]MCD6725438.1 hypothetical protein [Vibrio cholerae]MCU8382607.1 hypothetical protein [Vibrio vulnificus]MCU8518813.1 hypothetical protein [Vibrio vulnificus]
MVKMVCGKLVYAAFTP